jgi:hypothetical protein
MLTWVRTKLEIMKKKMNPKKTLTTKHDTKSSCNIRRVSDRIKLAAHCIY